jgi:hypothetical protein
MLIPCPILPIPCLFLLILIPSFCLITNFVMTLALGSQLRQKNGKATS